MLCVIYSDIFSIFVFLLFLLQNYLELLEFKGSMHPSLYILQRGRGPKFNCMQLILLTPYQHFQWFKIYGLPILYPLRGGCGGQTLSPNDTKVNSKQLLWLTQGQNAQLFRKYGLTHLLSMGEWEVGGDNLPPMTPDDLNLGQNCQWFVIYGLAHLNPPCG